MAEPSVKHRLIESVLEGPHGTLPVRSYLPENPTGQGLVWAHGGAFSFGNLDMPETHWVSAELADRGIGVVAVGYRLAPMWEGNPFEPPRPGVHFPVASEEVQFAFEWAVERAHELGVGPGNWSIGGASAGGNLAAGASMRLRDNELSTPASVVLAYPVMHEYPPALRPSALAFGPHRTYTNLRESIVANYVGEAENARSPYAFPAGAGHNLERLPPTLVLTSESDELRASGEQYAAELAAAGGTVLHVCEPGTVHGHLNEPDSAGAVRSIERITAWLGGTGSLLAD